MAACAIKQLHFKLDCCKIVRLAQLARLPHVQLSSLSATGAGVQQRMRWLQCCCYLEVQFA